MGEPRHCCGVWPCEYVHVTVGPTAEYKCGAGAWTPFPAIGGRVLKLVTADADYHRWEYRSQSDPGITYELTLECDARASRRAEGYGPCIELTMYYNNGAGLEVGFGPTIMDIRQCTCLNPVAYDEPANVVGFNWGQAFLSGSEIVSTGTCNFRLDAGDTISAKCLCSGTCDCVGFKKELRMTWACPDLIGGGPVVIDLDFYDYDSLPGGASLGNPVSSPYGGWWGEATVSGCRYECYLFCNVPAVGGFADPLFFTTTAGACNTATLLCSCHNLSAASSQCHTDSQPFELVYNCCTVTTVPCPAPNIYSTITITER